MARLLLQRLRLRMLRAIDSIERHKGLLKASNELGITQPALTRTLHEVEEILGGQIFERHSRGVAVTPFGEVVCVAVRRVLSEISRLDQDIDRFLKGDTRVVAVGAMPPAAIGILPDVLGQLRAQAPDIHVHLTQGSMEELAPLLNNGLLDMIVGRVFPSETPDEFVREVLYYEPFCVMARTGHPVAEEKKITVKNLLQYRFVLPSMSAAVEREIETTLATMNLTQAVEMRTASLPFLREILHTTDLLLMSPPMTMAGDLKRGTLLRVKFKVPGPPRPAGLLMRRDYPLSAASVAFIQGLRGYLTERSLPS